MQLRLMDRQMFAQMGLRMSSEVTRRDVSLAGEFNVQLPHEKPYIKRRGGEGEEREVTVRPCLPHMNSTNTRSRCRGGGSAHIQSSDF